MQINTKKGSLCTTRFRSITNDYQQQLYLQQLLRAIQLQLTYILLLLFNDRSQFPPTRIPTRAQLRRLCDRQRHNFHDRARHVNCRVPLTLTNSYQLPTDCRTLQRTITSTRNLHLIRHTQHSTRRLHRQRTQQVCEDKRNTHTRRTISNPNRNIQRHFHRWNIQRQRLHREPCSSSTPQVLKIYCHYDHLNCKLLCGLRRST